MARPDPRPAFTRREFLRTGLKGLGLLSLAPYAPSFLTHSTLAGAPPPEKDRTILVLIQLGGGNDGLNTCIPFTDDRYYTLRPRLSLDPTTVLPVADDLALHPACTGMERLYKDGQLAIVQNVGYPNPNRSHFRSTEIWETATDSDVTQSTGWLGRFFDNACSGSPSGEPCGIHWDGEEPQSFTNRGSVPLFGLSSTNRKVAAENSLLDALAGVTPNHGVQGFLSHSLMNALVTERRLMDRIKAYRPSVTYPTHRLAQSLSQVAALITGELPTRVYFVSHGGFDTHSNQLNTHNRLLGELSSALTAFQDDLRTQGLHEQVLTMTFSEFGRRPYENNGIGTDHGTAAPLFIAGGKIGESLIGNAPNLDLETGADLQYAIDFRQVYATILDQWLATPSAPVLGREFEHLPFLQA